MLTLAAVLTTPGLWATTYTFTGPNYTSRLNFTSCAIGTCANFTTSMSVSGSFTTASPLAANFSFQNIVAQVTSYSFSDGLDNFNSTDPNARAYEFLVSTNASGQISSYAILLEVWTSGTSPHAAADRFNYVFATNGSTSGLRNDNCTEVGAGVSGAADSCFGDSSDASRSAASSPGGSWVVSTAVPAVSEWGLMTLAVMLGIVAWLSLRRRTA